MAFNAGTLASLTDCVSTVQEAINRGTLSATSKPKLSDVENWLKRAKQELVEEHGFTWKRVFSYMDTVSGTYRYSLPNDFGEGAYVLRDLTQDERLVPIDTLKFDTLFPDVAGRDAKAPDFYTVKDREIWLAQPAAGTYRIELEYDRTGDDTTPTDISWLPELMRFKICDYAIYRSFVMLEMFDSAAAYKSEWSGSMIKTKRRDTRKRWKDMGYRRRLWWL